MGGIVRRLVDLTFEFIVPKLITKPDNNERFTTIIPLFFNQMRSFLQHSIDKSRFDTFVPPSPSIESKTQYFADIITNTTEIWRQDFPKGAEFLQKIESEKYGFAIFSTKILKDYVIGLSADELKLAYKAAIKNGLLDVVSVILATRGAEIDVELLKEGITSAQVSDYYDVINAILQEKGLTALDIPTIGSILCKAAEANQLTVVQTICNSKAFKILKEDDLFTAFKSSIEKGYTPICLEILKSDKFTKEMLTLAFQLAVKANNLDLLNAIINKPVFAEFSNSEFTQFFRFALENQHSPFMQLSIMQLLLKNKNFAKVDAQVLGKTLELAIAYLQPAIVEDICKHPNFDQINEKVYSKALETAVQEQQIKMVKALMLGDLFKGVDQTLFRRLITTAVYERYYDITEALIDTEQFKKLSEDDFYNFFELAAMNEDTNTLKALQKSHNFTQMDITDFYSICVNIERERKVEAFSALMKSEKFQQLSNARLIYMLNLAIENRITNIAERIIKSAYFYSLQIFEVAHSFTAACEIGDYAVVKAFMSSDKFENFFGETLGIGLVAAATSGHIEIVSALIKNPKYKEIPQQLIELAEEKATVINRPDIVALLKSKPPLA